MTDRLSIVELTRQLTDDDPNERAAAAQAMAGRGEDARDAAVALVHACGDENESVREWVVSCLEEVGPPRAGDMAPLADLLGRSNADVAYWAATLLGRLARTAAAVVGPLAAALSAERPKAVRQRAAWALGQIGPAAAEATASLRQAAGGDDPRLARLASRALQQLDAMK